MIIIHNTPTRKQLMLANGDTLEAVSRTYGWEVSKSFAGKVVELNQYDIAIVKRVFEINGHIYEV